MGSRRTAYLLLMHVVRSVAFAAVPCLVGLAGCGPWDPVLIRRHYVLQPTSSASWQVEKIVVSHCNYPNEPDKLGSVMLTLELADNQRMNIHLDSDMSLPSVVLGDRDYIHGRPNYAGVKNKREDFELTPLE